MTSPHSPVSTPSYRSVWRVASGSPLLGPSDSGCEEDDEPTNENISGTGGGGGGGGGVRPHTRSASRHGDRPRGWSEARTVGGGSEGRTRNTGSSGGATTISTTSDGITRTSSSNHVQILGMNAATLAAGDSSSGGEGGGGRGGRWHEEQQTPARAYQATAGAGGDDARIVHGRRRAAASSLEVGEAGTGAGGERPLVGIGGSRSLGTGPQSVERRSLSALLREIEETMRAQRAQRAEVSARSLSHRAISYGVQAPRDCFWGRITDQPRAGGGFKYRYDSRAICACYDVLPYSFFFPAPSEREWAWLNDSPNQEKLA